MLLPSPLISSSSNCPWNPITKSLRVFTTLFAEDSTFVQDKNLFKERFHSANLVTQKDSLKIRKITLRGYYDY